MAPKYGEFTFDSCCGFTGSAGKKAVKGYMRGGYAEGGMRSERTEEAKAARQVQDDAFAPAKQLNKSLKNLNRVRKETGYGLDDNAQGFARGGFKMRKMRSDKGTTQQVDAPKQVPSAGPKMPGMLDQSDVGPNIANPTPPAPLALQGIAKKKGGKC